MSNSSISGLREQILGKPHHPFSASSSDLIFATANARLIFPDRPSLELICVPYYDFTVVRLVDIRARHLLWKTCATCRLVEALERFLRLMEHAVDRALHDGDGYRDMRDDELWLEDSMGHGEIVE